MGMLKHAWIIASLLWCATANAEIYPWVDQDGRIQFSDRWTRGSEQIADQKKPPPAETSPAVFEPKSADVRFKLTGVALDSHRLQIRITVADDGRIVAQSSPHSFHVQKPEEPGQLC